MDNWLNKWEGNVSFMNLVAIFKINSAHIFILSLSWEFLKHDSLHRDQHANESG